MLGLERFHYPHIVLVIGDIEAKLSFLQTDLDQWGYGRKALLGGLIDKCDVIF
jgi:hypothetical protein